jgi:hypothetical protein
MPSLIHTCPRCSVENPCYFSEGEIVALRESAENEPAPWTGIVLEVERDKSGRVYRVLWGPPPATGAAYSARHSGEHRGSELLRFVVPLVSAAPELIGGGGGGQEGLSHRLTPPGP